VDNDRANKGAENASMEDPSASHSRTYSRSLLRTLAAVLPVAIIMLLAAALRMHELDTSYWIDEVNTHGKGNAGLAYAWSRAFPLCYVFAHFTLFWGDTEALLRLPALTAGILGVPLLYVMGKSLAGRLGGLLAALMLAVSVYHIHWSQIARYYSFVMLFGMALLWLLSNALSGKGRAFWIGYSCMLGLGALTHATFLPIAGMAAFGAFVWTMLTKTHSTHGKRMRAVGILVLCTFLGLAVPLARNAGGLIRFIDLPSTTQTAPNNDSAGSGKAESANVPPRETNILTPGAYKLFFKAYFSAFAGSAGTKYSFIILGLCGAAALWFKHRPSAVLLAAAFIGIPLPFFLVKANHFYSDRYFCIMLPLSILLISVGLARVAAWCAKRCVRPRDDRENTRARTALAGAIQVLVVGAAAAALAPATIQSIHAYYEGRPERDWKGMAQVMSQTMAQDDLIAYGNYHESLIGRLEHELGLYLALQIPSGISHGIASTWCRTPAEAQAFLRENPHATIWLIGDDTWPNLLEPGFLEAKSGKARDSGRRFGMATLWEFGKPTVNLCQAGDFESPSVGGMSADPELLNESQAYSGNTCARLTSAHETLELPIAPTSYPVRNAGFELWADGLPVGWDPAPSSAACAIPGMEPFSGRQCVELRAGSSDVLLRHRVAIAPSPGMEVEAGVWAKTDGSGALEFALEFDQRGERQALSVRHSGGNGWKRLSIRALIPQDADPGTAACVLRREAGGSGRVFADEVTLTAVTPILDPALEYTLSMQLKHHNSQRYLYTVMLTGEDAQGAPFSERLLYSPHFSKDWFPVAFSVIPGQAVPARVRRLGVTIDLTRPVRGTLYIDDVQFEAHPHPTPIVNGSRLPHDEYLAGLGY
jgi:dolichyl-phosphate-mannose-protein mannosyltransferase